MKPVPPNEQRALVERLTTMCGGAYSPETRRKYFISGPQWAAAYQGQALFYAPTRKPVTFEDVIRELGKIGIGYWTTHDSDVIPPEHLGTPRQHEIIGQIQQTLKANNVQCSMVTTETFYHEVFAAGPAAESPEIREAFSVLLKSIKSALFRHTSPNRVLRQGKSYRSSRIGKHAEPYVHEHRLQLRDVAWMGTDIVHMPP